MGELKISLFASLMCLKKIPYIYCTPTNYAVYILQLRNPKEVTTEEYNEFYKKTFNEYLDPLASSHFTTEVINY